ncbi:MAG TPA: ParB/RepB/Spo0J family partition protein [Candidatus Binataceae bacterium]|nr:ParB/RepB/Spo0J family partition protein [Candidatus Binataceae bacterium]
MLNRRPLGRGLDALIENTAADLAPAEASADAAGARIVMAPLGEITPSPFQPRLIFDAERLEELARAIASQGVIEPLIVRVIAGAEPAAGAPRYELIAGERRLRAAKIAGLETVPVVIRELDDRGALEMSIVENLSREDLNAVEESRALKRLHRDFGLGHDDIAARIGKSRPYVTNSIRLLDLPIEVLEMIARGELSAGQARPLLSLETPEAQLTAALEITAGKISARGAEALAAVHRHPRTDAPARAASDPNLNALAEGIQRALKRKVRILKPRGKSPGRIELDYYDDPDLTALASSLMGNART